MQVKKSMTNESFSLLEGSSEFLNLVLNNIKCCVLLLDSEMKLHAFNNPLKTIFSNKKDEDLLYQLCGESIGCAYQIEESKSCGKTSKCFNCELRLAAMESYLNNKVVYNNHINKPFFNHKNEKIFKDLRFSTRLFIHNKEKYILMLVDDISELVTLKKDKVMVDSNHTMTQTL